ncbi:MAG: helix-turn-helix domain-containing protein [Bacillota bacterium]|jgi:AraC-like DNA-binding protein
MKNTLDVKDSIIPPFQPDIECKPFYKSHVVEPDSPLSGIISDYYQFATDRRGDPCARILPDACIYMVFELDPLIMRPVLFTCTQFIKQINLLPHTEYFCARFYPGAVGNYFNCHIDDILNQPMYLDETMHKLEYKQLLHELHICNDFEQRIAAIARFIEFKHALVKEFKNILIYSRNLIITSSGTINMGMLSKEINYSQRYLRQLFQNYIGVSPKTFCEILKFQKSFAITCFFKTKYTLCDIALLCGYYDHSQMDRAYIRLVDKNPTELHNIFTLK